MTQCNYQDASANVTMKPLDVGVFAVTGTGTKSITCGNVAAITDVISVQVENTSHVRRVPQGAVTFSGNVISVADSGFASGEVIHFVVAG